MLDSFFHAYLDESHLRFYETCARFCREEIVPHAYAWEEAEGFPRELYVKAGGAGILGPAIPVAAGGPGGDILHTVMMIEALMPAGAMGVLAGLNSLDIALPPILALGTEEQKRRFVPRILCGEDVAALAITEPDVGSDVAGLRTSAVRRGDHYILNGAKAFITSGVRADQLTLLARTGGPGRGGLTFFVVERKTPGYSVSTGLKKIGWRSSDTALITFHDCMIPVENRLGEEGSGFKAAMQNFQNERMTLAAYGHAAAEVALAEAERYARDRAAFGHPISGFQVIRHKMARMATLVRAAKSFNYMVARAISGGREVIEEVSEAKNFSAQVVLDVCSEAVQIFGGMGCMRESIVERLYRDARVLSIGGGTTEIMNEVISRVRGYGARSPA